MTPKLPIPNRQIPIVLAWMVDLSLLRVQDKLLDKTQEEMEEFLWLLKEIFFLRNKPVINRSDCWALYDPRRATKIPYRQDAKRILFKISLEMGLQPAALYRYIEKYYDPEFYKTYHYSYTARCCFGNETCVRPSHLIPCDFLGHPISFYSLANVPPLP